MNHRIPTSYPSPMSPDLLTGQPHTEKDLLSRNVGQEMMNYYEAKVGVMRDATSSKLNIKGPKAADNLRNLTMKLFRLQLEELPEEVREHARMTMLLDEDVRRRDLQEFQCELIFKLEQIVIEQMQQRKEDRKSFRIGGHDRGTFERFYRVEPMLHMSKPQFITALRKSFGDGILKSAKSLNKLYDSFDLNRRDEADWRSFLFLLTLVMQPFDELLTHLRWAFAIYSSIGTLDFDNMNERMTLSAIKNMICTPVVLCLRPLLCEAIEDTWISICVDDEEAITLTQNHNGLMEDIKVPFTLFVKLITSLPFAKYLKSGDNFGIKDNRPWNYRLEKEFYHPVILKTIMHARREARNEEEVKLFVTQVDKRIRRRHFERFVAYVRRREKVRRVILVCSTRWKNVNLSSAFDRWRVTVLENAMIKQVQRIVRGFNARRRRDLIKRINRRAVKVQSGFRSISKRIVFVQYNRKRIWGALTIQRMVRGRIARRRVISIVEAKYELGLRRIRKDKEAFFKRRALDAAILLQFFVRKWYIRQRIRRREDLRRQCEVLVRKMDMEVERGRVENSVYKGQLEIWFQKRREEYEMNNVNESNARDQLRKIIRYRKEQDDARRRAKEASKEALLEKQEEERIELWIKKWEEKIAQRVVDQGRMCHRVLILPETPEEVIYSKEIREKIRRQTKVVLRRADKQKIPMEVPEAEELAKKEVIDDEMEAERERAKAQMREEATQGQAAIEAKKDAEVQQELRGKKRKRKWGAQKIQSFFRILVARRKRKELAYTRYKKHFDLKSVSYYYEDIRTKRCAWSKPKSLGMYDIDSDPGWVVLFDNLDDMYFYQPKTMKMQWTMPFMAQMCQACTKGGKGDFAVARLSDSAKTCLCEACFNTHVVTELGNGVPAQDIRFKPFHGNREDAASTVFGYIPEMTWWKHLLSLDPSLKESEDELKYQQMLKNKKKGIQGDPCTRCNERDAVRSCDMCQTLYCEECYEFKHKTPPWDNHSWTKWEVKVKIGASSKSKKNKSSKDKAMVGGAAGKARSPSPGPRGRSSERAASPGSKDGASRSNSPSAKQNRGRSPAGGRGGGRGRGGGGSGRGGGNTGRGSGSPKARSPSPRGKRSPSPGGGAGGRGGRGGGRGGGGRGGGGRGGRGRGGGGGRGRSPSPGRPADKSQSPPRKPDSLGSKKA